MNEKDPQLVDEISELIEVNGESSLYLFHARYTNLARLNLVLLDFFLRRKRMRGLLVNVDRPHPYVTRLMQTHGLDDRGLTFLDVTSAHCLDGQHCCSGSVFHVPPFNIEKLPSFVASCASVHDQQESTSEGAKGFVMIDNLAGLLAYNTMNSLRCLVQTHLEVIEALKPRKIQTVIIMDGDQARDLFNVVAILAGSVSIVGGDMHLRILEPEELMRITGQSHSCVLQGESRHANWSLSKNE